MARQLRLDINKFLGLWYDDAGDTNIPVGALSQLQNFQMLPSYKLRKRSGYKSLLDKPFSYSNSVQITLPAGRMAGDVDGDGQLTLSDLGLIASEDYFGKTVTDESTTALKCCDVNGDQIVDEQDTSALESLLGGKARRAYTRDILGVWSARPDLTDTPTLYEDYVFYTDISVPGIVAGNDINITIDGDNDIGLLATAERMENVVRVFTKRLPTTSLTATISTTEYSPDILTTPYPIRGQWYGKLGERYFHVVVAGGKAYVVDQKTKIEIGDLTDAETNMFQFGESIYFQNGVEYKKFTGVELVDESEVNFNSKSYSGDFPVTLTLPPASYRFKLGGGKGQDKTLKIGRDTYTGHGGKGGTINFRIDLKETSTIRIEKITNGSETYRTSFHVYINDVLYAAVGGGGDANMYGLQTEGIGYLGAMMDGGHGGGTIGENGRLYSMGTPAQGANGPTGGAGMIANANSAYNSNPPINGDDYPISKGGVRSSHASGGCGYAGGGAGGYASTKTESYYWYGSGAGGSSYVKEDSVLLYENSRGTNNGEGYISINTIREYLSLEDVEGYIPIIYKGTKPDGTSGTAYEPINALTGKRRQMFNGDNTATTYKLAEKNNLSIDKVIVDGVQKSLTTHYTVNATKDTITFVNGNAPPNGVDNVEIHYTHDNNVDKAEVLKYTHAQIYGGKNDNRIFFYGHGNRIIYSDLADGIPSAEYFPVINTMDIGSPQYDVTGLTVQYDRMLIHKERGTWWTHYDYDPALMMANFPVYPLNDNVGASYTGVEQVCQNDPFVLYNKQLWQFVASNVRDERNVDYLSKSVQPLLDQLDFTNVKTLDYEKYGEYWIILDNRAYIYNYRMKVWFYYYFADTITAAIIKDGNVVLGTAGGDLMDMNGALDDNGTLINAFAETGWIDYGYSNIRKLLNFIWVHIFPEADTNVKIYYQTDYGRLLQLPPIQYKNLDFANIDFADFAFGTGYNPRSFRLKARAKNFVYIKFTFINDTRSRLTLLGLAAPAMLGAQSR